MEEKQLGVLGKEQLTNLFKHTVAENASVESKRLLNAILKVVDAETSKEMRGYFVTYALKNEKREKKFADRNRRQALVNKVEAKAKQDVAFTVAGLNHDDSLLGRVTRPKELKRLGTGNWDLDLNPEYLRKEFKRADESQKEYSDKAEAAATRVDDFDKMQLDTMLPDTPEMDIFKEVVRWYDRPNYKPNKVHADVINTLLESVDEKTRINMLDYIKSDALRQQRKVQDEARVKVDDDHDILWEFCASREAIKEAKEKVAKYPRSKGLVAKIEKYDGKDIVDNNTRDVLNFGDARDKSWRAVLDHSEEVVRTVEMIESMPDGETEAKELRETSDYEYGDWARSSSERHAKLIQEQEGRQR